MNRVLTWIQNSNALIRIWFRQVWIRFVFIQPLPLAIFDWWAEKTRYNHLLAKCQKCSTNIISPLSAALQPRYRGRYVRFPYPVAAGSRNATQKTNLNWEISLVLTLPVLTTMAKRTLGRAMKTESFLNTYICLIWETRHMCHRASDWFPYQDSEHSWWSRDNSFLVTFVLT